MYVGMNHITYFNSLSSLRYVGLYHTCRRARHCSVHSLIFDIVIFTMITNPSGSNTPPKRGAFILLEGVDRCGKTTQVSLLVKHLLSLSLATVAYRFPDRTTQG